MPWGDQGGNGGGGGWKGGGGQGPWGQGPSGKGPQPPDLEDLLRQGQEKFKKMAPGGSLGGKSVILIVVVALVIWGFTGFYRVNTDEQGVELVFGKFSELTQPGLNYHLPYPIAEALTPKVTRVNRTDIGMRASGDDFRRTGRRGTERDVPEESLMLTGDENIVDLDFSVFWVIKDAGKYLFNVYDPVSTVKAVAESAMREIVGQNKIQPILSEKKQEIEDKVKALIQKTLDNYDAGILVSNVQLQKTDPPAQVIEAFRDVQAAEADQERAINEATEYANKVVPVARGQASRIMQGAEAYKARVVAEAVGQASRYKAIYKEYAKAPDVTRKRMFLETLEKVLGDMKKVIIDEKAGGASGVVPYLPLNELTSKSSKSSGGTQ